MRALVLEHDPRIGKTLEANLHALGTKWTWSGPVIRPSLSQPADSPTSSSSTSGSLVSTPSTLCAASAIGAPYRSSWYWDSGSEAAKFEALDLGADDFLMEPFGMGEFFARLRAVTRRPVLPGGDAVVITPDFTLDLAAKQAHGHGKLVHLTRTEWRILEVFAHQPGCLVTYEQLFHEVSSSGHRDETNYLRTLMTHIRRELEPEPSRPRYFTSEPGLGFRFELPDEHDSGDQND